MKIGKVIKRSVVTILAVAAIGMGYYVGKTISTLWQRQIAIINTVMTNDYVLERHILSHGRVMTPIHGVNHNLVQKLLRQTVVVEWNGFKSSGVVLDSKKGIILTCSHCVNVFEGDVLIIQTYYGERFIVDHKNIKHYPKSDLAVVTVGKDLKVKSCKIANGVPRVGDQIIIVGCPYELEGSVSTGIISAKNRPSSGQVKNMFLFQTDAALNPGNSGGPWFNMRGELIALSATKYMFADNVSFGIPIDYYKRAIK